MNRCSWLNLNNQKYIDYHDNEWGKEVHDDRLLFEMLILEGAQAGLSWETILNKRDNYKKAFDNFDVEKIVKYDEKNIEKLLSNEGIVRNKLKVNSVVKNAKVFIEIQNEYGSFDKYLWGFGNNKQKKNHFKIFSDFPTKTDVSDKISKDLKKRGMSFVGSTIIYAYMQAVGLVCDHEVGCFKC